jgi:hypothetical protein
MVRGQKYDLALASIHWLGRWRIVAVAIMDGSPLIGMRLLEGCELKIACIPDGPVEITPLP